MTVTDLDDWRSAAMLDDPYSVYRRLRDGDPVHWNPITNVWVLTRHADVAAAIQDRRLQSAATGGLPFARPLEPDELQYAGAVGIYLRMFMQGMDPPQHTRQRALVQKAFTPRTLERLRPRVEAIVAAAFDRAAASGEIEVMRELAVPLPETIIMELLGVPPEGREVVHRSAEAIAEFLTIVYPAPGQFEALAGRLAEFAAYLLPLIAARRAEPHEDLLSALAAVEEAGERLAEAELLVLTTMLLFAGHETTTNLIGNGVLALAEHPGQWQALHADPARTPAAVEEMLRYDTPVQIVPRWASEPLELGGKQLAAGDRLLLNFAAANRDPAFAADPDRFDISRPPVRHLSFGHGAHFCLGAALARMEAHAVFSALARRFTRLELAAPPVRKPNVVLRGHAELRLRLS